MVDILYLKTLLRLVMLCSCEDYGFENSHCHPEMERITPCQLTFYRYDVMEEKVSTKWRKYM